MATRLPACFFRIFLAQKSQQAYCAIALILMVVMCPMRLTFCERYNALILLQHFLTNNYLLIFYGWQDFRQTFKTFLFSTYEPASLFWIKYSLKSLLFLELQWSAKCTKLVVLRIWPLCTLPSLFLKTTITICRGCSTQNEFWSEGLAISAILTTVSTPMQPWGCIFENGLLGEV